LPELYAHLNPMPYEAAAQMEKDLTEDLRRAGHTVVVPLSGDEPNLNRRDAACHARNLMKAGDAELS